MKMNKNTSIGTWAATAAFAGLMLLAAHSGPPASAKLKIPSASAAQAMQGKALVTKMCAGCHGADLAGRKGRSPSIRASHGPMQHYTKKQFERLMDSGITDDGKKVMPYMPAFKMSAAKADSIYAYLKTQK